MTDQTTPSEQETKEALEKERLEKIKEANDKITKYNEGNPNASPMELLPENATLDQAKEIIAKIEGLGNNSDEGKPQDGKPEEGKPQEGDKRQTLEANSSEKPDWTKSKEAFWKKHAEENGYEANMEASDGGIKISLLKDGKDLGSVTYTSSNAVAISKDSSIEIYKGLVKDAIEQGVSITFGETLDDKQKAMLLAACLQNKEKYKDGGELELVNPPKIDLEAEYFKDLPKEAQETLKGYVEAQQPQTNAQTQANAQTNAPQEAVAISKDSSDAIEQGVSITFGETLDDKQRAVRNTASRVKLLRGLVEEGLESQKTDSAKTSTQEQTPLIFPRSTQISNGGHS